MDSKEPKEKHVICKYLSEFKQMRVTLILLKIMQITNFGN